MTDTAAAHVSLETVLNDEIVRMYQEVADNPKGTFHFFHGREAAEAGFTRIRSAVVPQFRFRKESTQNSAEAYGVKAVMMTALKP
jgi:hypothetical protein